MKWVNVNDRLPPEGLCVVVRCVGIRMGQEIFSFRISEFSNGKWFDFHYSDEIKPRRWKVTHWMLLSEPLDSHD